MIRPDLIRRMRGGWLAISPKGAVVRIGVVGATEEQAAMEWAASYSRWLEILALDTVKPCSGGVL